MTSLLLSDLCCVTYSFVSPSAFSRRAVVSYWRKYVHEVLVNRLGGLSLPRKSVGRLTDRSDMTLDVYHGRKTTMQHATTYSCKMVHFGNSMLSGISVLLVILWTGHLKHTDTQKSSFILGTIRNLNTLPFSLISSAEVSGPLQKIF